MGWMWLWVHLDNYGVAIAGPIAQNAERFTATPVAAVVVCLSGGGPFQARVVSIALCAGNR